MDNTFGQVLRKWRQQRRFSQFQLAIELGISSKHISFIETGRSNPSRDMILKIGEFLLISKREINRGLHAAGYAPIFSELSYGHEDLKHVYAAIEHMLTNHMPYPAIVLNQHWDVVNGNGAAHQLLAILGYQNHNNLIEAIAADNPTTSRILNWQETASTILIRLKHEINLLGGSAKLEELEAKLATCLLSEIHKLDTETKQSVLSVNIQTPNETLSFFSIIAQLTTVQDVSVSEYRVELMFPANSDTEDFYKRQT